MLDFVRRRCAKWYRIREIFMISPSLETGTDNSSKIAEKRSDGNWIRWTAVKEKERRLLLDVLQYIHPKVRFAWKYKGSDGYVI